MNSFDWQKAWQRTYNNASDDKWKTKSLNPTGNETYEVKLPSAKKKAASSAIKTEGTQKQQREQELLPSPNMTKINETMFCITLDNQLCLFYLPTSNKKKQGKTFRKSEFKLQQNIVRVIGLTTPQGENFIVVATKDSLILLKVINEKGEYQIRKMQETVSVPDFRIHLCFGKYRVIAASLTHIYEFQLVNDRLKQIVTKKIQFSSKGDEQIYKNLLPIGLVAGYGKGFYYFGSKEDDRLDTNKIKGIEDTPLSARCEALTIVKLKATGSHDIEGISAEIYPIDHIFEFGMFNRTKIYEIQQDTFLFSLHQEIILIKKHFNKYIVWDNVSVISSKSQSKKGQLILLAQTILAYSEPQQIFVHQIFFQKYQQSKLKMPTIDNFKGSENEELVLYDALMLSTQESVLKVLAYVKQVDIIYPANSSPYRKIQENNKGKQAPTAIQFTLICINQNDPKRKLQSLILLNKRFSKPTTQEIKDFCERFNITEQDYTKCKWNVSDKKQKDIQDVLMLIKDDEFIKFQLDSILKQQSHQLSFLSIVEAKQIGRLKDILSQKVNEYVQRYPTYKPQKMNPEKVYIFGIMKWLMESQMFAKKIAYSRQFLTFKEYDFIEIGKLRAASLKEEIKLLSQKKFIKRLKNFINQFKNLVIANFQEVFTFLLIGKSVPEIQKFIRQFPFILPKFKEDSQVFIERKQHLIIKKDKEISRTGGKRQRYMSFCEKKEDALAAPQIRVNYQNEKSRKPEQSRSKSRDKHNMDDNQKMKQSYLDEKAINDTRCMLWGQDEEAKIGFGQSRAEDVKIPQTLEVFLQNRLDDIRKSGGEVSVKQKATEMFPLLLQQFTKDNWFKVAAFKQHCMITKTSKDIQKEFEDLKKDKSFLILVKFLYGQLDSLERKSNNMKQVQKMRKQINELLRQFIQDDLVPESFVRNVEARIQVYELLKPLAKPTGDKRILSIDLPKFQQFLIKTEPLYFAEIYEHIRKKILTEVKDIYDKIEVGFFKERFGRYLQSDQIRPYEAIQLLNEFSQGSGPNDDIRKDVFNAIIRLLYLQDKQNSYTFIQNSLDKSVLPEECANEEDIEKLKDEAKIPYGYYFYNLYIAFNINYTYEQLISFTKQANIKNNLIINQIVQKYCRQDYKTQIDLFTSKDICRIDFQNFGVNMDTSQKIEKIDIHKQPLEFFGLLMIFLFNLDFIVMDYQVFQLILQNYLNLNKFSQLSNFIRKLKNYHISQNNMNTKNYQMIRDFKDQNDITQIFIEYILNWIKRNYDDIRSVQHLKDKLQAVQNALDLLDLFHKNVPDIKRERALFVLLTQLQNFDPQIITDVQHIKKEVTSHSGFIFLMHMFKKIGIQRLKYTGMQPIEIVGHFFSVFQAHQEYLNKDRVDYYHSQFIRFLIELCLKAIQNNEFEMAKYLLLYKIPNDNQYFIDVILMFLAASNLQINQTTQFYQSIKKQILEPQTTSLIRNNFERLIKDYNIMGFIQLKPKPVEVSAVISRSVSQTINRELESINQEGQFYQRCVSIFKLTIQKYRKDDAFFFIVRVKTVKNASLIKIANQSLEKNLFKDEQQTRLKAHFLITSYIKILERYIQKEFYPTYRFFQSKILMLSDIKTRIDVIKDINIAMSKLQRMWIKDEKNNELFTLKNELQSYYNQFMFAIGEDPEIKLVDYDTKGATATIKAEVYSRSKNIEKEEEKTKKQINQHKKIIQQNINKTHQVQEQSRFNILNREVTENINQIRKANERHAALQANIKKQKEFKQVHIAEKKAKELQQIQKKEKEDIQSIKDSYKSNTTKRVNDLIENLRKKREEVKVKTYAPTSAVREETNTFANMKDSNRLLNTAEKPNLIRTPLPQSAKKEAQFLPVSNKNNRFDQKFQSIPEEEGRIKNKFLQLQKKVMNSQPSQPFEAKKNKKIFEDIAKLYRQKESQEALKCIQKYDLLKEAKVRCQFIKRAYTVTNNLDNFIQFCKFLIDSDATWKETIQEKSISTALQMLKMQLKQKITIKQIIPDQFFTKVSKISLKDYYGVAYDIFKPKIVKILQKELMSVHSLGIIFRYSLGSETRFYNKVFYQYLNVLLSAYQLKNYDDKELITLAEKIRSNYSNLPDNKTEVLQKLLQKITNPQKKIRLLQCLTKVLERKTESIVGGNSNKEVAFVVQKLLKMSLGQ